MSVEETNAAARAMLERIFADFNATPKRVEVVGEVYAPILHRNGVEMSAYQWQKAAAAVYLAFPDATQELVDVAVEDDRVFCRYVMRGTHTGDLTLPDRVIPATGRKFEVWGLEFRRIQDGRFIELWSSDVMSQFFDQLEGR